MLDSYAAAGAQIDVRSDSIRDALTTIEVQRRHALKSLILTSALVTICLPLAGLPFYFSASSGQLFDLVNNLPLPASWLANQEQALVAIFVYPMVVAFILLRTFVRYGLGPRNNYLANYKRRIYSALCAAHFPGMTYKPRKGVHWKDFDATELFPYTCDEYHTEDQFSGQWGTTEIRFAEAVAKRVTRRLRNKFEKAYETYFQGVIFIADFHKHFHSTTRLVPRGEKIAKKQQQLVQLESPEFDRTFSVLTTDQVDVRYILSTSMMERLTQLNRRHPGMRAKFADENLLLLLPTDRNQFEPSLFRRAASKQQIQGFIDAVNAWLEVVRDLDLNTRIWSKH